MSLLPMQVLPVSVVIVSRGRPDALRRCLLGLSQLQYGNFELIVVADPAGIEAAGTMNFADDLKLVSFDQANISTARNMGIDQAAGEVVAFIDDDAVPEPTWLTYLTAPATRSDVAAMAGYVRGRNGISFQYRAQGLDATGMAQPLEVDPQEVTILKPPRGRAVKTEGTNMAFRRSVLVDLGGFDSAFRYFLDETDLNMRLARAGHATAIVPLAEVHHGFAANAMRASTRVPTDLFDIGASWAVFQRKHIAKAEHKAHFATIRANERRRLLRHMVSGLAEPRDVRHLMNRLEQGYVEGQTRSPGTARMAAHSAAPFKLFPALIRPSVFQAARGFSGKAARAHAVEQARNSIASVLLLSPTALYHRVSFDEAGIWVQRGGIFGRAERREPLWRWTTFARRTRRERSRIARQRGLTG